MIKKHNLDSHLNLICTYMKMIRQKINGFEAGLTAPGSVQGVLCDEPYDIALHCHKTMIEYQKHFKTGHTGIRARRMKKQFVIMSKYRILCNDTSWPCKGLQTFQNVVRALCLTEYWNGFLFCKFTQKSDFFCWVPRYMQWY